MQRAWSPKAKTGTLVWSPSASINSQTREVALREDDSVRGHPLPQATSLKRPSWVCSPEGGSEVFSEAH